MICLKRNSRRYIRSVSAVKLLYSIFMSIDTSMTSPNSHLFMLQSTRTANDICIYKGQEQFIFSSILSIFDNL